MWKTDDFLWKVDVMFSRARREEIEVHNEEVRQNRGMLVALLEVILYLPKQILPFRGHGQISNNQIITLRMFSNSTACGCPNGSLKE